MEYALRKSKPMTSELLLQIELVPESAWGANLRRIVSQEEWDRIRRKAYADAGYRCEICGARGRMNCHEVWDYDDEAHVMHLAQTIALCESCHLIKHIGFAGIQAAKGVIDMGQLIYHFMATNHCDRATFEEHKQQAWETWERRSNYLWKVDLGVYKPQGGEYNA